MMKQSKSASLVDRDVFLLDVRFVLGFKLKRLGVHLALRSLAAKLQPIEGWLWTGVSRVSRFWELQEASYIFLE